MRFIKPKIKRLGISGRTFGTLLKKKSVNVGNKTIRLKDVTFNKPGRKIVYATDTRPTTETLRAAANADILIHEATYADAEKLLAKERYHSTTIESAGIAKRAKVKRLILTHTSARYKNGDLLKKDARRIFKNTEVAEDGLVVNL